jgi:hypothetical protein
MSFLVLAPQKAAHAQHATDDPLATANDAFGLTLGLESIGLYGPGGIRGFNPQSAGNVRIDGLYFDQQGALSNRVVEGSTIRIGVSEIGYAFPAPTGIVDYDLRHPGNGTPSATVVASAGPFPAHGLDLQRTSTTRGREPSDQHPDGGRWIRSGLHIHGRERWRNTPVETQRLAHATWDFRLDANHPCQNTALCLHRGRLPASRNAP